MVVIAALIGAGGLGLTVYVALGRLDIGSAVIGGTGIVILAIILVALVLLQGSDNEGLGLGGGGGMGGMMSARGSANLLSRLTAATATLFMVMSIVLTIAASVGSDKNILQSLPSISSEENNVSDEPVIPENN